MTLGSLFAGVGGFDLGFERARSWSVYGRWRSTRFAEPFWLLTGPRWRDMKTLPSADHVTSQESIASRRESPAKTGRLPGEELGSKEDRSGLFFEFARILRELRPTWFVFENVPGLFSSNGGRDFAEVQRVLMVECGYGISWRVLNSQFLGVAQRRCRVYIVGHLGRPCPPEVLFEPASGGGHPEHGRRNVGGSCRRSY